MNYCQAQQMKCIAKYSFCINLTKSRRLNCLWNLLDNMKWVIMRSSESMIRSKKDWGEILLISSIDYRKISFSKKSKVTRRKRILMLMKSWKKFSNDYLNSRTINDCWFLTMWIENIWLHRAIWKSSMWKNISRKQITNSFLSLFDSRAYDD